MGIHTVSQIMSQNLAVKAAAMNSYKQQLALTGSVARVIYDSATPEKVRNKLRTAIQTSEEKAYRQLRYEAKLSMIPVDQQVSALRDVPLVDKRKLLDAMPIIPVPIGSAFLGVAEADLHDINSQSGGVFGDIYMRRRCNSMNELALIAKNPGWLGRHSDAAPALTSPDSKMLDGMTYVDIWTAMAYINMSWDEMKEQVEANGRYHRCDRTYRVSDLEEIRVAKLRTKHV
ncbi:hypothetical protein HH212_11035 [Massilia forsythiae]|uniref:Uncharacterized protein n=1 Tax=Massilia forsythiae TaxID=2728020 RepID=A0A7Z2VVY5_9BURK|nr:hypothetical protein [Massilia forsythiae]QJE00488.1 hypothetical protein HH212_11035 [Massilia forsythiae]